VPYHSIIEFRLALCRLWEGSRQTPRQPHAEENGTSEFEWYQAEPEQIDFRFVGIPNEPLSFIHNPKNRGQGIRDHA
jgi:hypothetical protein